MVPPPPAALRIARAVVIVLLLSVGQSSTAFQIVPPSAIVDCPGFVGPTSGCQLLGSQVLDLNTFQPSVFGSANNQGIPNSLTSTSLTFAFDPTALIIDFSALPQGYQPKVVYRNAAFQGFVTGPPSFIPGTAYGMIGAQLAGPATLSIGVCQPNPQIGCNPVLPLGPNVTPLIHSVKITAYRWKAAPSIPEPTAALAFLLGAIVVRAGIREW